MTREHWKSRLMFIFAASAGAIGLGNIWKFPYLVGSNGGAIFLVIYFLMLIIVGYPILVAEISIGKIGKASAIKSFTNINKPNFAIIGLMGVVAAFFILGFYNVVSGWVLKYLLNSISGEIYTNSLDYGNFFTSFVSDGQGTLLFAIITCVLSSSVLLFGINDGIGKFTKYMLPALFILLIILIIRALTLPNAIDGIKYFLVPDFSKISASTLVAAAGQVFFTLSVGMGAMLTYGSYLNGKEDIAKSSFYIVLFDTLVAILAGFLIFPVVFSFGTDPTSGPSLVFITLPELFAQMPFSRLFSALFFSLLLIAAVTSIVSLMEVVITTVLDKYQNISRVKATVAVAVITLVFNLLASYSMDATLLGDIKIFGRNIFDLLSFIAENIILPLGGILICIFVGWVKSDDIVKEINFKYNFIKNSWLFLIKYVTPLVTLYIFLSGVGWL